MIERSRSCKQLLLLVGSNPLPNFLTALVLRPESICLFFSPETEPFKDYLQKILKEKFAFNVAHRCIGDATDPAKVRDAFTSIESDSHLNYTGGTKIMAAHARMAFRDIGGTDSHASYLDDRKALLHYDDGYSIDMSRQDMDVRFDEVLGLHGIEAINISHEPGKQDIEAVAAAVLARPELAAELYRIHRNDNGNLQAVSKAKQIPVDLTSYVRGLSIQHLPEQSWVKDTYRKWCKFLGGDWFEYWCGDLVRDMMQESEVFVGVDCQRANKRIFEIDVAFVRRYRLYVISCTTDTTMKHCKPKLFEVAMRARQLGGDLARSAMVCLLHGSNDNGLFVEQLQQDAADIWDASNTPQVFGLDDISEWVGLNGPADVGSFKKWIES